MTIDRPTREDHIYRGRVYRYVVWAYSRVAEGFDVLGRTDFYDHAKNVAERVPAVYNERPGWIHELKEHDKVQASTKKKTTMANEQVIDLIRQIPLEHTGVFHITETTIGVKAEIERLTKIHDNLLAAEQAARWLDTHGFEVVDYTGHSLFFVGSGEFCAIPDFTDADPEGDYEDGLAMPTLDKQLFVLRRRQQRTSSEVYKAMRYLQWLVSECDDAPTFIKQMEKKQ